MSSIGSSYLFISDSTRGKIGNNFSSTILLVKLEFLGYHIENQYNFVSYVKDTLIALVVNAEMFKYPFRLSAS